MCRARSLIANVPDDASAPQAARRALDDLDGCPQRIVEVARLLVSELVTNGVRHATNSRDHRISLTIDASPERLRVAVEDTGEGDIVIMSEGARRSGSGFGVYLVDKLADRWGIQHEGSAKSVWFELDVQPISVS